MPQEVEPDLQLLKVIAELGPTNTERLDEVLFDLAAAAGGFRAKGMRPPWFGRQHELEALADADLLIIDDDMGEYHVAGAASPITRSHVLEVTPAGRAALAEAGVLQVGNDPREFEAECRAAAATCRSLHYNPDLWVGMMDRHGAVDAAKQLLTSGDIQFGFSRLIELGRPDLTIEWAVLEPRWIRLFNREHRQAADWRLAEAGVTDRPDGFVI